MRPDSIAGRALPGNGPMQRQDSEGPPASVVGLIGVGLVGAALAERFLGAGLTVRGFDVESERRKVLERLGGVAVDRIEAVGSCARVVLSLPGSEQVRAVIAALRPDLQPGQLIVDTTTGDPEQAAATGEELAALGVGYLDATLSGSSEQVRSGEAVVMAGGTPEAFAACTGLFRLFAREAYRLGPWGSGSRMKLVSNLVLGLNRAALAEGLALAGAWGMDPLETLAVLRAGAAYSRVMDVKGERMIARDFAPQARLSQHHKDVGLILGAADRLALDLPLSRVHEDLLARAEAMGLGGLDNSAIVEAYGRPGSSPLRTTDDPESTGAGR